MSKFWVKLYHECVTDPKIMMRSPMAQLRFYQCLCLAGERDADGELPPIDEMAFVLRVEQDQLVHELGELVQVGIFTLDDGVYQIARFTERQGEMSGRERVARHRREKHHQEYISATYQPEPLQPEQETCNENVTKRYTTCNESVTNCYTDIDIDIDKDIESDGGVLTRETVKNSQKPPPAASSEPDQYLEPHKFGSKVFMAVTGMVTFPAGDRDAAVNAIESLRMHHPTIGEMSKFLKPFFQEWLKRKYSRSNLAWLTDWAVSGEIPHGKNPDPPPERIREDPMRAMNEYLARKNKTGGLPNAPNTGRT